MKRRPRAAVVPSIAVCNLERIMTPSTPSARIKAVFETALAAWAGWVAKAAAHRIVDAVKTCGGLLRETVTFLMRAG